MPTIDKLHETLEMLETKENLLCRKAATQGQGIYWREEEEMPEFIYLFADAMLCLKKKRMYERQVERLASYQSRVHNQVIMLKGARATAETVYALRTVAAATMKAIHMTTYEHRVCSNIDGRDSINVS